MLRNLGSHVRDQWMGALALFIVLASGTAYAANTVFSGDIVDGEVKAPDLAAQAVSTDKLDDGAVTSEKVKDETLRSRDVLDDALGGADIDESTLSSVGGGGPAGGDLAGTYPNPQIGANAIGGAEIINDSLAGADIAEATLGQVPSARLGGFGRTGADTSCDPESTSFETCAATAVLTVPPGARALVLARVTGFPEVNTGAESAHGLCRLGTSSIGTVANTEVRFAINDFADSESQTLVGITPPLPAGATSFGIDCNQLAFSGAIAYNDVSATVLLISSN